MKKQYICFIINTLAFLLLTVNLSNAVNVSQVLPPSVPPGGEFKVSVTIDKGTTSGFAKYQVELPEGLTATAIETETATFSFTDQKVKFIWMALPAYQELKIVFRVKVSETASGIKSIGGTFSYIENNETQKFAVTAANISIEGGVSAQTAEKKEEPSPAASTGDNSAPAMTASNPATDSNMPVTPSAEPSSQPAAQPAVAPVMPATLPAMPSPASASGVTYRVQLAATQQPSPENSFKEKYNIDGIVFHESLNSLHKYTSGNLKLYTQARNYRNEIRLKGIAGAFVVAYNNGQRISVQEALIITRQKWVK